MSYKLYRGREILEARNEAKKGELDEQLKVNKEIIIMNSDILNVTCIIFSVCINLLRDGFNLFSLKEKFIPITPNAFQG